MILGMICYILDNDSLWGYKFNYQLGHSLNNSFFHKYCHIHCITLSSKLKKKKNQLLINGRAKNLSYLGIFVVCFLCLCHMIPIYSTQVLLAPKTFYHAPFFNASLTQKSFAWKYSYLTRHTFLDASITMTHWYRQDISLSLSIVYCLLSRCYWSEAKSAYMTSCQRQT